MTPRRQISQSCTLDHPADWPCSICTPTRPVDDPAGALVDLKLLELLATSPLYDDDIRGRLAREVLSRRAQETALRATHREIRWDDNGTERHECADCEQGWPCATTRLLDGDI